MRSKCCVNSWLLLEGEPICKMLMSFIIWTDNDNNLPTVWNSIVAMLSCDYFVSTLMINLFLCHNHNDVTSEANKEWVMPVWFSLWPHLSQLEIASQSTFSRRNKRKLWGTLHPPPLNPPFCRRGPPRRTSDMDGSHCPHLPGQGTVIVAQPPLPLLACSWVIGSLVIFSLLRTN